MCSALQIQSNAFTVLFDERFSIPLDAAAVEEYSLRFSAFGVDLDERNISAGQAELKLSDLDLSIRPFDAWLYLQDINKVLRKPNTHQHTSSLSTKQQQESLRFRQPSKSTLKHYTVFHNENSLIFLY